MIFRIIRIVGLFIIVLSTKTLNCQSLEFVYLQPGAASGNCSSLSDPDNNIQCYGMVYTPSITGTIFSYSTSFFGDCLSGSSPYLITGTGSCIMTNNTDHLAACTEFELFQLQLSGNSGTFAVTAGVPVIVHQVCFDLSSGGSFNLVKDEVSPISFGIEAGGMAMNDFPVYETTTFSHLASSCEETELCSISFSADTNQVMMDTMPGGLLIDSSGSLSQSFDLFDEITMDCALPGGNPDVEIIYNLISTIDINGNGIIDSIAGMKHRIIQDSCGIRGFIPFNVDADSESSPGDVRGYSITVNFADHVGIIADQITVHLNELNGANSIFESASIVFFDAYRNPYGTAEYVGLFNGENDLTGNCLVTAKANAYHVTGLGVVVIEDGEVVNLDLPCDPAPGIKGPQDSLTVNARLDGGLDSAAVISGFTVTFLGEDVAAPSNEDLGIGLNGDDLIRANSISSSSGILTSYLQGITIKNCIFQQLILPVEWISFIGRLQEDNVILDWQTASEINNSHFNIEWSTDGRKYTPVGKVKSTGDLQSINFYSFVHRNAAVGYNYYRIQQVDIDGQYEYSKVISVLKDNEVRNEVIVSPNPFSDILEVSSQAEILDFYLMDVSGHPIVFKLENQKFVDLSSVPKGIYFAVFNLGSNIVIKKVVKL